MPLGTRTALDERPGVCGSLLRAMRPRQWLKNLFVLAPLLFAAQLDNPTLLLRGLLAAVCFCGLSGATYLINDVWDRRRDTLHPVKRHRPVASGALTPRLALIAALYLIAGSLGLAAGLSGMFLLIACAYVLLMLAYCFTLRNVVIADVASIAGGFVLRVVGGGVAVAVPLSQWLLICTALLSLFLALGKRRHELISLNELADEHRPVLRKYNEPFLDQLISITATACLISYLLYCMYSATEAAHAGILLTAPFVTYGLFRYLYCIYRKGQGGSPEDILLRDKVFLGNGLAYTVTVLLIMYWP
jgi:4-hydroxybenzoate polyprenyltransferase